MSTAVAASTAIAAPAPAPSQNPQVPAARVSTTGTNSPDTRSASRCAAALRVCASSTSAAIWASRVSAPTRVACTTNRPSTATQPPLTSSPGPASTGSGSPLIMLRSSADAPSSTNPSAATFSPGRTTNRSPTTSWSAGTRISRPSRSTTASFAASDSRARSAAPDRRRALASAYRPASTNVTTPAATSR
jgi:hypothetical protein